MNAFRAVTLILLWVVLWAMLAAVRNEPRLAIAVEGGHFHAAPAEIRLKVRVQPDKANRGLTVSAESDRFSTSSFEQLEGEHAPVTRWIPPARWKDVPEGQYRVHAVVDRGAETPWREVTEFVVIGREGLEP